MKTEVLTVRPETPLTDLDRLLSRHRINGIPVLSRDGELLGMVSRTDVIRHLSEGSVRPDDARPVTVADIMVPGVVGVDVNDDVVDVARMMLMLRFHRVLVFQKGKVAGIASAFDMLQALVVLHS